MAEVAPCCEGAAMEARVHVVHRPPCSQSKHALTGATAGGKGNGSTMRLCILVSAWLCMSASCASQKDLPHSPHPITARVIHEAHRGATPLVPDPAAADMAQPRKNPASRPAAWCPVCNVRAHCGPKPSPHGEQLAGPRTAGRRDEGSTRQQARVDADSARKKGKTPQITQSQYADKGHKHSTPNREAQKPHLLFHPLPSSLLASNERVPSPALRLLLASCWWRESAFANARRPQHSLLSLGCLLLL
jgi:hypothetical protein